MRRVTKSVAAVNSHTFCIAVMVSLVITCSVTAEPLALEFKNGRLCASNSKILMYLCYKYMILWDREDICTTSTWQSKKNMAKSTATIAFCLQEMSNRFILDCNQVTNRRLTARSKVQYNP